VRPDRFNVLQQQTVSIVHSNGGQISYYDVLHFSKCLCIARAGDALDFILDDAMGGSEGADEEPGMLQQLSRTMTSLNRFMKSLQN
jgi:hypothetical protein